MFDLPACAKQNIVGIVLFAGVAKNHADEVRLERKRILWVDERLSLAATVRHHDEHRHLGYQADDGYLAMAPVMNVSTGLVKSLQRAHKFLHYSQRMSVASKFAKKIVSAH